MMSEITLAHREQLAPVLRGMIVGLVEDDQDPEWYGLKIIASTGRCYALWFAKDHELNGPGCGTVQEIDLNTGQEVERVE